MAVVVARLTVKCPGGDVVRRLIGPSAGEALNKAGRFDPRAVGSGCSIKRVELVKRGVGAGAPDRFAGGRRKRYRRRRRRR